MTPIVLTFVGHDRPGLVNAISEKVAASGGAWLERNRVWRKNTAALQHETPVLMPTACQGLVT